MSFLHWANNEDHAPRGQDGHDRLFKIRPLIDLLVPKFGQLFYPGKELALDEMTIAFKGRNIMKQYNKNQTNGGTRHMYSRNQNQHMWLTGF